MDVQGASILSVNGAQSVESRSRPVRRHLNNAVYQFTQQNLPACKPVLIPSWVISMFFLIGVVFIPIGLLCLYASESVVEIIDRYDTDCVPDNFKSQKVAYIKDSSVSKNCTRYLKVPQNMKAPIYIYYQLDNYYQNHRRYVKSRSDKQLLHGLTYNDTSSCNPEGRNNGLPIVPCGLIAWSLFNDTYSFFRGADAIKVNRKNIAWRSDREHKFGKNVYPFNFQSGSLIGGATLDPNIPLSDQEDLIIWMRTAALPTFRKLYGRIEVDLEEDDLIMVNLVNNYNTYSFGGRKKLVLSTTSWLGGRNNFLGMSYVAVGSSFIFLAFVFLLLHVKNPSIRTNAFSILWGYNFILELERHAKLLLHNKIPLRKVWLHEAMVERWNRKPIQLVNVNEVEALYILYKKLSSSIIDDGLIHKEEFLHALFSCRNKRNLFADKLFELFDLKSNGFIEFGEFVRTLSIFHPKAPEADKITFAFKLYDLKNTGYIERDELKDMVLAILQESELTLSDDVIEAIVHKTFQEADLKGDGRIDPDEWKELVTRYPSLIKIMTLSYLEEITVLFPCFVMTSNVRDSVLVSEN